MAGKVPQYFIDDLIDRADIVDVVSSRVQLKKTGKNYSACCPFHEEKTPSFTVSPDKQFYYCFGCKASGNSLGFMMDFDRLSFPEAIEDLAKNLGMDVPREETTPFEDERAKRKKKIFEVLKQTDKFFRDQLRHHPSANQPITYLKERGLSGQIAAAFGIGFAPPGWDNVINHFNKQADQISLLNEAGLVIEKPDEKKCYDRFRNRIQFPIRDTRGRTIGFGGRVLGDDKPKYLNSPETPVFHKGRELYGLYEATQSQADLNNILVVEGYMDVVALAQYGIHNAVATLGTAVGDAHLTKLFRYTPEVVFCFDGDLAGRHAAQRALEISLRQMEDGRSAKFLFLPDGEDPDTLVRQIGSEDFRQQISNATPLSTFLFDMLADGLDTKTPDGKSRLSKLAAPYINSIPTGVFKEIMIGELANFTGLDRDLLSTLVIESTEIETVVPTLTPTPETSKLSASNMDMPDYHTADYQDVAEYANAPQTPNNAYYDNDFAHPEAQPLQRQGNVDKRSTYKTKKVHLSPERVIIALLLNYPELAQQVTDMEELSLVASDEAQLFIALIQMLQEHPEYTLSHILGLCGAMYGKHQLELLAEISANETFHTRGDVERDNITEFNDTLHVLKIKALNSLLPSELIIALQDKETLSKEEKSAIYKAMGKRSSEELTPEVKAQLKFHSQKKVVNQNRGR